VNHSLPLAVELAWFFAALLLLFGLRNLSIPSRARNGLYLAAAGMVIAVLAGLAHPELGANLVMMIVALLIGGSLAWWHARRPATSSVAASIAIYSGLGGGAAAAIATVTLLQIGERPEVLPLVAVLGGFAGSVSLAGSLVAAPRLHGRLERRSGTVQRQVAYLASGVSVLLLGVLLSASTTAHPILLLLFLCLSLTFGVLMTLPVAVVDLPVAISIFNALSGLAVALDGFVLGNTVMTVAGTVVFAAGLLLTRLMARSANRRLGEIMYSGFGVAFEDRTMDRPPDDVSLIDADDAAVALAYARRIVVVPGFGMATSQAQHKLRELTQLLEERGVETAFAIHPVAGRMPGHMDVLLAEAGVPYDRIHDLADINEEFDKVDRVLVVGASDIVNPAARTDPDSPLYELPILDVDKSDGVIALHRGTGTGYSGAENPLFSAPGTRVLQGDARQSVQDLITALKELD